MDFLLTTLQAHDAKHIETFKWKELLYLKYQIIVNKIINIE